MTFMNAIEFLENDLYIGRDSWPDNMGVGLDKDKGICFLKRIENGREMLTNYLWLIEDFKATDWTIIFFD